MLDLSIVIVTWNSREYIESCLNSIFKNLSELKAKVLVVDNGSSDGTVEIIRERFLKVKIISNRENRGFAKATNQGLKVVKGRYALLLNPDTVVRENALQKMIKFMDSHSGVGALGPKLLNPDGTVQPSCREFPTFQTFLWEFTGFSKMFPNHKSFGRWRMGYFDHQSPKEVDQLMGACIVVRRDVLERVGLLDERFPLFFNEVDWCYRIKHAGWKIMFFPDAEVIHYLARSTSKIRCKMIALSHLGAYNFFRIHNRNYWTFSLGIMLFITACIRITYKAIQSVLNW